MASGLDTAVTGGAPNLPGSLAAAARPLPENADWQAYGVEHVLENCAQAWVHQQCSDPETGLPLNDGAPKAHFHPFLAEFNVASCTGGFPQTYEQMSAVAKRGMTNRLTVALETAISASAPDGSANESPNLPDSAVDVTGDDPATSIACAVGALLAAARSCGANGEAFIHAPDWLLPHFLAEHLLTQVGNVFKLGPHTVVFGQGYVNEGPTGVATDPDTPTASPGPTGGQAYLYLSGPVEFAAGAVQVLDDTTRGRDVLQNAANVMAVQLAVYRFDPCCVQAILVEPCGGA